MVVYNTSESICMVVGEYDFSSREVSLLLPPILGCMMELVSCDTPGAMEHFFSTYYTGVFGLCALLPMAVTMEKLCVIYCGGLLLDPFQYICPRR